MTNVSLLGFVTACVFGVAAFGPYVLMALRPRRAPVRRSRRSPL